MKVAVIGSRHAPASVSRRILEELPFNVSEIVSGGAEGVDRLAERVADILGIPVPGISARIINGTADGRLLSATSRSWSMRIRFWPSGMENPMERAAP